MPAPQTGSPMTYMLNGKQYIVVAVSGAGYSGELIAFRLPSECMEQLACQTIGVTIYGSHMQKTPIYLDPWRIIGR